MNSYQVLEQETNLFIAENNEEKMRDVLRRISNLTRSPTCSGYPWANLIDRLIPILKQFDRDRTVQAIEEMRKKKTEATLAAELDDDLDDSSEIPYFKTFEQMVAETRGMKPTRE